MAFRVTVQPQVEPVRVTDQVVLQAVKLIDNSEDAFVSMLLSRSREAAEQLTWRALITQDITLVMDKFPVPAAETVSANWYGPQWGVAPGPLTTARLDGTTGYEILLPRAPLQQVLSIVYIDSSGVQQTLPPAAYLVDSISEPARITPAPDTAWPATQNRANAVTVTFRSGYGDTPATVPMSIRHWIVLMAATLFENREMVAILNRGQVHELPYVDSLLAGHGVHVPAPPTYWA